MNELDAAPGRHVWYQYYDSHITYGEIGVRNNPARLQVPPEPLCWSCPPEKPHLALRMRRTARVGPAFASRVGKFRG